MKRRLLIVLLLSFLDVTLLQALDSVGWNSLRAGVNLVEPTPSLKETMLKNNAPFLAKVAPKDAPGAMTDTVNMGNNNVMLIDCFSYRIGIFGTRSTEEIMSVLHYGFDLNVKHKTLPF